MNRIKSVRVLLTATGVLLWVAGMIRVAAALVRWAFGPQVGHPVAAAAFIALLAGLCGLLAASIAERWAQDDPKLAMALAIDFAVIGFACVTVGQSSAPGFFAFAQPFFAPAEAFFAILIGGALVGIGLGKMTIPGESATALSREEFLLGLVDEAIAQKRVRGTD